MRSMATVTPEAVYAMGGETPQPSSKALPSEWVDRLFSRLDQTYPGKWVDSIKDMAATKQTWAEGLGDMSGEEIRRGLAACLNRPWPPTLPEFRRLCRPPRCAETEFRRAANIMGSDPIDWGGDAILYWAVQAAGPFEVRSRPYEGAMKARWEEALRDTEAEYYAHGLPHPPLPPMGALEVKLTPKAEARERLAELKRTLAGRQAYEREHGNG